MFGFLTRKRSNRAVIEAIYAALIDRARDPVLFTDFAVDDSFEGRFETLTLFSVLLTRRLKALPAPAPDLAQDLIDHVFAQFDRALRESGVGDLTVPKRMKTMASAFMGRASAYDQALTSANHQALADALLRNIYASQADKAEHAQKLSAYAVSFDKALASARIETLVDTIKSVPQASQFK
jgi:cytochrome b pre-mRNA-processing protein 3